MFALIKEWIVEHGSAAVMRERIAQHKERIAELERLLKEAEAVKVSLESANKALAAEVEALRAQKPDVGIAKKRDDQKRQDQLREVAEGGEERGKVLHYVCVREGCEGADIAAVYDISEPRVIWHLEQLKGAKLVMDLWTSSGAWDAPRAIREWRITEDGRDVLVSFGLI